MGGLIRGLERNCGVRCEEGGDGCVGFRFGSGPACGNSCYGIMAVFKVRGFFFAWIYHYLPFSDG